MTIDSSELDSGTRRALRARAHALQPVVMIGDAGLTPTVLGEIETALKSHALIKIRVLGDDRGAREALLPQICEKTGAQPVQTIGKLLVIYRPKPPEAEKKALKKRPGRKPRRRLKRSFQNS